MVVPAGQARQQRLAVGHVASHEAAPCTQVLPQPSGQPPDAVVDPPEAADREIPVPLPDGLAEQALAVVAPGPLGRQARRRRVDVGQGRRQVDRDVAQAGQDVPVMGQEALLAPPCPLSGDGA